MRATQITRFGGPDVLKVHEVDRPTPGPGEVLVAVQAASINGHDAITRAGGMKMVSGRRFPIGLGLDFLGTVAALGSRAEDGADRLAVGNRGWGTVHPRQRHTTAAAADYVVVPLDRVGPAPAGLSATDAVALVVAGATALRALYDVLGVRAGQHLLVRGAAGGVGTAAVQLAAACGVRVSALASARHADALRDLGADEVLDRAHIDLADIAAAGPFDAVLDTVGTQLAGVRRAAGRHGRTVTIAISGPALGAIVLSSVHGAERIRTFSADPHRTDLDALAAEVNSGHLRPVVAAVHPFDAIVEAHRAFERGGVLGKQVLDMTGAPSH
jgi:NADPH:quinone reductase-like Zn-dependent oxidoreductase